MAEIKDHLSNKFNSYKELCIFYKLNYGTFLDR